MEQPEQQSVEEQEQQLEAPSHRRYQQREEAYLDQRELSSGQPWEKELELHLEEH